MNTKFHGQRRQVVVVQPTVRDMLTLFLDFDGVLHPEFCHESKHFSCLPHFESAVRRIPDASIVITSTWRLTRPLEQMLSYFSTDVARMIVGATPRFNTLKDIPNALLGYERQAECEAWLRSHQRSCSPWLAIDDRAWLFRPFNKALFLVDSQTGMTPQQSESLVARALALQAGF